MSLFSSFGCFLKFSKHIFYELLEILNEIYSLNIEEKHIVGNDGCSKDWDRFRDHCYFVSKHKKSWFEAEVRKHIILICWLDLILFPS